MTRRGSVEDKRIEERIKKDTEAIFQPGSKELDRRFWPARSNDVPNRAVLTMVILGQDTPAEAKTTLQMMESIVRDCGSSGRTYKSALIFAVPDATTNLRDATRNALAWEDIDDDEETKKRIDDSQLKLLKRNMESARRQLKEDLFRAYRHLYLLDKNNTLRHIDLGQITSSATTPSDGIVGLYIRELRRNDEITEGVSPLKLVKYWPPALTEWSTASVRDAFYSSPQLPRLLNPDIVKRAICDGVTQGLLGYATKDSRGNVKLQKLKESLFDTEVEISGERFYPEGRGRPEALGTAPVGPVGRPAGTGHDQDGRAGRVRRLGAGSVQPAVPDARRGVVGQGRHGHGRGRFYGRRHRRRLQRSRPGRWTGSDCRGPGHDQAGRGRWQGRGNQPPGKRVVSWRGKVPPQKWMNFYTKVLTRFAAVPDLKLEVFFQAPLEPDQADAKSDEARSGLKELGLGDDVNVA